MDKLVVRELQRVYGSSVNKLLGELEKPPHRLYMRVNTAKTSSDDVIRLLKLEGINAYPDPLVEDSIYVEVEGPFELTCSGAKEIIVDEKTAVSLYLGANLYRPGLVKAPDFRRGEILIAVSANGVSVACIEAVIDSSELANMSKGLIGVNVSSRYKAPRISETRVYAHGLIYPQSLPSIITTHVLSPKPGELIVDMNAAPGGKTSHILQLTRGKARLVSIDRSEKKVEAIKSTLKKLQLDTGVLLLPMDSRYIHLDLNLNSRVDKVLIDPPCSNLGIRPLLGKKLSIRDIENLVNYQRQFLKSAYHVLKPGGKLVYSTCTITMKENEENIRYAVEELGLTPIELEDPPPYSELVKYKGIVAYRYSPLYYDMPGYFIAVLTK